MARSRKVILGALAAALLAGSAASAQAGHWHAYRKWYGWAGPCYGGFGGYPGARYACGGGACGWYDGPMEGVPGNMINNPGKTLTPGVPGNSLIMDVHLPADAVLLVNGQPAKASGAQRVLVSKNLQAGQTYTYELKAMIQRDGRTVSETQVITVGTGEGVDVAFNFQQPDAVATVDVPAGVRTAPLLADDSLRPTSLIVHVPDDARVFLGGNPTRSTGPVREFKRALTAGDRYEDYTVRVEVMRDGKLLAKETKVSLSAGDSKELQFDFDSQDTPLADATADR